MRKNNDDSNGMKPYQVRRRTPAGTTARGRQAVFSHPKPTGPVPIAKPFRKAK